MTTTGRMTYGNPPPRPPGSPHRPWRAVMALAAVVLVVVLSSGWLAGNWRTFDSNADVGLCHC